MECRSRSYEILLSTSTIELHLHLHTLETPILDTAQCNVGMFRNECFFETPKVGVIGIFILLKYENELELVTSDISINSVNPLPI